MSNNSGVIKLPIGNVKRLPSGSQIEMVFDIDKFLISILIKMVAPYTKTIACCHKELGTEQQSNISITGSFKHNI